MEYSKEFEYLWQVYPKRKGIKRKKCPAWKMWLRLTDDEKHEVLTKARYIKQFEGDRPRDLVTWLHPENQRGWEDIVFKDEWVPVLPEELTKDVCKMPEEKTIDINTERNKQRKALGIR